MVPSHLTNNTAACDWVSEMTRLKCGSWADARLFHYKYVKLLAPDQSDTWKGFLCTNRVSTNFWYKEGTAQRILHLKKALSPPVSSDAWLLLSVGWLPLPLGTLEFCTQTGEKHIILKMVVGGLGERQTARVWCPAPGDVGVQTKGASPQVNEGAGKHEHFGPGIPPAALFSNPDTQRPSWWSPQACTTFTLRTFCFSICLFVFA